MTNENTTFNPVAEQGEILDLGDLFKDAGAETLALDPEEQTAEETPTETAPTTDTTETPPEPKPATGFDFKGYIKRKIDSGQWFDVEGLDEMEVDEETFDEIVEAQKAKAEETAKEGTVKTDSISPLMQKALEIDKAGGDVSQVFETYKNIYENPENPIANLDLNNPTHQEQLLKFYHKNKGLGDFEIQAIIDGHKRQMTLGVASENAKNEIDTVFNNYLQETAQKAEQAKIQQAEALKQYRTNVSDALKKYDLNDNFKRSIVEKIAKPDERGMYGMDAVYDQWRRDPEKVVRLMMFMNNEEEYVKTIAGKIINGNNQKVFDGIKLAGKGKSAGIVTDNPKEKENSNVIPLTEI